MRILVYGDSITVGLSDTEGGWVARLRKHYDGLLVRTDDYDVPTVMNMGISGNSTIELVKRFVSETEVRSGDDLAIIFAIGANDSRTKEYGNFSNTAAYQKNLEELHKQASGYTDKILFVGLAPCDEDRTTPVAWNDTQYHNKRIKQFDETLQKFCTKRNLAYIGLFDSLTKEQQKRELLRDGIHPNNEGHALIFEAIKPKVEELLGQ